MNAEKARQLSLQIKNKLITENEINWLKLSESIFNDVKLDILNEKTSTLIDLRLEKYNLINNSLDYIEDKLRSEGYYVTFRFERSIDGKREMIIRWE